MNIIIPMAGMGKRMRPHTLATPKPLLPIAGKPIVQRLVEDIVAAASGDGVGEIAFVIGRSFGAEVEKKLLSIADGLGARGSIQYQDEPLGTAHAILCASEALEGPVFVAFADTLFRANFSIDREKDAIIWAQRVEDPSAFGVVQTDEGGKIIAFVEKPKEFISDLAIIGVYYFKDGALLRRELQRLIDEDIKLKGEYQLTDAMDHMLKSGIPFYTDVVDEWLDCGNYEATVYTAGRVLEMCKDTETLQAPDAVVEDSVILQPSYIGPGATVRRSVVGPHASIEAGAVVEDSRVQASIVGGGTTVRGVYLNGSMLGKSVLLEESPRRWSLGDFSTGS